MYCLKFRSERGGQLLPLPFLISAEDEEESDQGGKEELQQLPKSRDSIRFVFCCFVCSNIAI